MLLDTIEIQNIKSFDKLKLEFGATPGWHVILGDNGSGKSTIIKLIAMALIGHEEIMGFRPNWNHWLQHGKENGEFSTYFSKGNEGAQVTTKFERSKHLVLRHSNSQAHASFNNAFSAGFGPFRRFRGGNSDTDEIYHNSSFQRLAAHLTLFGEDIALSRATKWLHDLHYRALDNKSPISTLDFIKGLLNSDGFLPHGIKFHKISSDGLAFLNPKGTIISMEEMSDGFRSILSLAFELLRLLHSRFGTEDIYSKKDLFVIKTEGIVLIDEIDAHLHPEWQTRIGDWFKKYFPNIQFIVTTHSPLICRCVGDGKIIKLKTPGTKEVTRELIGEDKDRLLYGNILEAYGTEAFGQRAIQSNKTNEYMERLGHLTMLNAIGQISNDEKKEMIKLKSTYKTSAPITKTRS